MKTRKSPLFDRIAFLRSQGSARPKSVNELRFSELNTQRFAAGSRGSTAGQGPQIDAK